MATKQTEKVCTPEFRLSYCKLATPEITKKGEKKWGITMIFDPAVVQSVEFKNMQRIIEEAKTLEWGSKPPGYIRGPFRKGIQKSDEYPLGYDLTKNPEYEGMLIASANSTGIMPDCRDAKVQPVLDLNDFYSGCYCRAFVVAYAYKPQKNDQGQTEGNYGITFGLQAVQFLRDGERLAGGVTDAGKDFEAFVPPAAAGNHLDLLDV